MRGTQAKQVRKGSYKAQILVTSFMNDPYKLESLFSTVIIGLLLLVWLMTEEVSFNSKFENYFLYFHFYPNYDLHFSFCLQFVVTGALFVC